MKRPEIVQFIFLVAISLAANSTALADPFDLDVIPGSYPSPSSLFVEISGNPLLVGSSQDNSSISGAE